MRRVTICYICHLPATRRHGLMDKQPVYLCPSHENLADEVFGVSQPAGVPLWSELVRNSIEGAQRVEG